jgi:subtilisin-like proprotein convertase family protein
MKTMQILKLAVLAGGLVAAGPAARAEIYLFTPVETNVLKAEAVSLSQVIPDNTLAGVGYGFNFTESSLKLESLILTINLSGGYNGDMYGYLQHNGVLVDLFNPATFLNGASGSVLSLSLASGAVSSLSAATAAELAGGNTYAAIGNLDTFFGANPAGLWTLYFADLSAGDQMAVNAFSLSITAVPEPGTLALVGLGLGLGAFARRRGQRP